MAATNRVKVKGLISLLPGIHLRMLQRTVSLSFNSTRYHVQSLTKQGEIIREQRGRYVRLYPASLNEEERTIYSIIQSDTSRRILKTLCKESPLANQQISDATRLAKSTVTEHLQNLLQSRLVLLKISSEGRIVYGLRDREHITQLLRHTENTLIQIAADRINELWDSRNTARNR